MSAKTVAALHHALREIYSGAEVRDAEALADQLADIGFEVTERVSLMAAHKNARTA